MKNPEEAKKKNWRDEEKTVTLTKGEWSSLTMYLLMSSIYREEEKTTWEKLAAEVDESGKPKYKQAASNARFWTEMVETINTVRKKIDGESD